MRQSSAQARSRHSEGTAQRASADDLRQWRRQASGDLELEHAGARQARSITQRRRKAGRGKSTPQSRTARQFRAAQRRNGKPRVASRRFGLRVRRAECPTQIEVDRTVDQLVRRLLTRSRRPRQHNVHAEPEQMCVRKQTRLSRVAPLFGGVRGFVVTRMAAMGVAVAVHQAARRMRMRTGGCPMGAGFARMGIRVGDAAHHRAAEGHQDDEKGGNGLLTNESHVTSRGHERDFRHRRTIIRRDGASAMRENRPPPRWLC